MLSNVIIQDINNIITIYFTNYLGIHVILYYN